MNTIKYFHGTNASNINDIIEDPKMSSAINGFGFYMSRDIEVAKQYGSTVICYEVPFDVADSMNIVNRPIDQRYTEDMSLYSECVKGGMEAVITNQKDLNTFIVEMEDSYIV